jgi:hypothetical protein
MAVVVTLDSVTTTDVTPTAAPHRISAIAGENNAAIRFTPTSAGGVIRMVLLMVGRTLASVIGPPPGRDKRLPAHGQGHGLRDAPEPLRHPVVLALRSIRDAVHRQLRYATIPADGGRRSSGDDVRLRRR